MLTSAQSSAIFDATVDVGKYVLANWQKITEVKYKGIRDPQTDIDVAAEKLLVERLHAIVPEAGFAVEEGEDDLKDKDLIFTIDPIDGTKFFSTQAPFFCTMVALMQGDTPILGAIYNPLSQQLFSAVQGQGAYLNGVRQQVSDETDLTKSIINLEVGDVGEGDKRKKNALLSVFQSVKRVYILGGSFPPHLITQTLDAYVCLHNKYELYDNAPRHIIWREAGAEVMTFPFESTTGVIAANPILAAKLYSLVNDSR